MYFTIITCEQNTEPNHDDFGRLQRFQTLADSNVDIKYVRYRPSKKGFSEGWGTTLIKSSEVQSYLLLDATTDEGRNKIAQMNGVGGEWEKANNKYDDNTHVQDKCYDLLHLVAKNNKRPFMCGSIEGWHRTGAVISLMTGRHINPNTGALTEDLSWGAFSWLIQLEAGKQLNVTVEAFQAFLHTKLLGGEKDGIKYTKCAFVGQPSNVTAWYISKSSEAKDLGSILGGLRTHSRNISVFKRTSSKRKVEIQIADLIMSIFSNTGDTAIDDNCCTSSPDIKLVWAPRRKLGRRAVESALKKAEDKMRTSMATDKERERISGNTKEMNAFTIPPILFDDEFADYCKAPFQEAVSSKMKARLTFEALEDPELELAPPFINSFLTMSIYTGKNGIKGMTTWMVNTCWFLPKIIHILYAEKHNLTLAEVGTVQAAKEMCQYAVRYHGNSVGLTNYNVDQIVKLHYLNIPNQHYTNEESINIIAAALFISDTINTILIHPNDINDVPIEEGNDKYVDLIKDAMYKTGHGIAMALTTINTRNAGEGDFYQTKDIIHALGLFIGSSSLFATDNRYTCLPTSIFLFLLFANSAMNYFCATEYAYHLKSIVATTTPAKDANGNKFVDRASKTALERYIYINVLREIMQVVAHYGLFPKLADKASEHAPQLVQAYDDICSKIETEENELATENKQPTDKRERFQNLLYSMGVSDDSNYEPSTNRVSFELARSIKAGTFDKNQCRQSILPVFVLQVIHCVKQSCDINITVEDGKDGNEKKKKTLVLKKGAGKILHGGTYIGDCVGDKTCPLNTLQFVDTILEQVSVMGMFQSTIDGVSVCFLFQPS
jgi:hypothetical protein